MMIVHYPMMSDGDKAMANSLIKYTAHIMLIELKNKNSDDHSTIL